MRRSGPRILHGLLSNRPIVFCLRRTLSRVGHYRPSLYWNRSITSRPNLRRQPRGIVEYPDPRERSWTRPCREDTPLGNVQTLLTNYSRIERSNVVDGELDIVSSYFTSKGFNHWFSTILHLTETRYHGNRLLATAFVPIVMDGLS